jgi:hypothetical protein
MPSPGRAEFAAQQRRAGHMEHPENVGQDIDAAGSWRSVIEKGRFRQEIGRLGHSGAPNSGASLTQCVATGEPAFQWGGRPESCHRSKETLPCPTTRET